MDAITVAIIGLVGSAIGSLTGIIINSKMVQYRIEQLERQVEKHNELIDRTYKLEAAIEVIDEKLREANKEIQGLEQ